MRTPQGTPSAVCAVSCGTDNDAIAMGSGSLPVFATPSMVALMEKAASNACAELLEEGETTVGTYIAVSHSSATPHGLEIIARAELSEVNGRELTFNVLACDRAGEIGSGIHKRVVVNGEKLVAKANSK